MRKPKLTTVKKSEFDLKCGLILINRKLNLDQKARAVLDLKKVLIDGKKPSKF